MAIQLSFWLEPGVVAKACPMYALDAGPLDKLRAKYGDVAAAEGFSYSERFKPSVTFKPKQV